MTPVGLGLDSYIDWEKTQYLRYPGPKDEGQKGAFVPGSQVGPLLDRTFGWDWTTTFPGIRSNGQIDFQW
jgi:hypothetical protein